MRRWRTFTFLGRVIAAAIITPSTGLIDLVLVVVPLQAICELGIIIAMVFARTTLRSPDSRAATPA